MLKATCHLNSFASKHVDCLFYGDICGGIHTCLVLDVFRPRRRPGRRRWRGCSSWGWGGHWLLVAEEASRIWILLRWVFEEPLPKTPVLASPIHHPVEDALKDEDVSFRQPRLWLRALRLSPSLEVRRRGQGCHFTARPPSIGPGKCLAPRIFPLKHPVGSLQPSIRKDPARSSEVFESPFHQWGAALTFPGEKVVFYGGAPSAQAGGQEGRVMS